MIEPQNKPEACPQCQSARVASIQYGLPDLAALEPDLDAGRIILGGCVVVVDVSPLWHCIECGHEWGAIEESAHFRDLRLKREAEDQAKEQAAVARGILEARVNAHGFARCPYCGISFSTRHEMSWDGEKHKSCKTRLRLTFP